MDKTLRFLLTLALPLTLGLASCSDDDPDEPNGGPLTLNVKGLWYDTIELEGTMPDEYGSGDYTRVINAMQFNEDGTGYGMTFFFDNESSEPIAVIGGQGLAPFTYTTTLGGDISVNYDTAYPDYADFYKLWDISYANETITFTNSVITFSMKEATEAMAAVIRAWDAAANGGASAEYFNPNDNEFNFENWREQDAIYIYDGVGTKLDEKGHKGYSLVNLPWYNGSAVQTNLPKDFCDNLTREAGWDLVMNYCGSNELVNGNFFAVYNKYTGTLRFFYFMPNTFSAGNDHVWQVSLSDDLAQHSLWGYGLPSAATIKDKSKLAATGAGIMVNYVTPWVDMRSRDGLITPNVGWWAFDVDLSLYRPNADHVRDIIKLQMRSWNSQHVSLFSKLKATIDGSISQKVSDSGTSGSDIAKGVLNAAGAALNIASGIASFGMNSREGVANGLGALASALGCGSEFAGIFGGSEPFEAEISLGMDGTIDTDGTIEGSTPNVGIASAQFPFSVFNRDQTTTLGQGVWNLKNHPVVHVLKDAKYYICYATGISTIGYYAYFPYLFDPSSVEVELNPNVFPDSEVEWVQVDATCVASKRMGMAGTDGHREGFGLASRDRGKSEADIPIKKLNPTFMRETLDELLRTDDLAPVFDYMSYNDDKGGMDYPVMAVEEGDFFYNPNKFVLGRGYEDGYAIEPILLHQVGRVLSEHENDPVDILVPGLEVNVVVNVKLKDKAEPITLTRNYLPELKDISLSQLNSLNSQIKSHQLGSKQSGHRTSYDYQVLRIGKVIEQLKTTFQK